MGSQLTPFGELIKQGLKRTGLSQGRLGGLISDFHDGPVFDSTGVRLIMEGKRRLTPDITRQIIEILDLDPARAWEASGLWPPGLTAEQLRRIMRPRAPALVTVADATPRRRRSDRPLRPTQPGKSTTVTSNVVAGPWPDAIGTGRKVA